LDFSVLRYLLIVQGWCTVHHFLDTDVVSRDPLSGEFVSQKFIDEWASLGEFHTLNAMYFVVVTLSTVGYGDLVVSTLLGRAFAVLMIGLGIVVFTQTVGQIVEQVQRQRGSGSFVKRANSRHVIVAGNPNLPDLSRFFSEFYSMSRMSNSLAKVVVLVENPSWSDTEWNRRLVSNDFLQRRCVFLIGSVRSHQDLHRARVATADAVFLVTSEVGGAEDASARDTSNVLDVLAIRNVRTDIAIYTTVLRKQALAHTTFALSTPSATNDPDLFFRGHMHGGAQYHGLVNEIAALNSRSGITDKTSETVLDGVAFRAKEKEVSSNCALTASSRPPGEQDLFLSTAICLQEIRTALIAAHVQANGVGTLMTNIVLDFETKPSSEDPPWLSEYQLGASCQLVHLVIPPQLEDVRLDDVAVELYDYGLVLMTTTPDPDTANPDLVLNTRTCLKAGDVAMFLTYHLRRYAHSALMMVALKYASGCGWTVGEGHGVDKSVNSSMSAVDKIFPLDEPSTTSSSTYKASPGGPVGADSLSSHGILHRPRGNASHANIATFPDVLPCNDALEAAADDDNDDDEHDNQGLGDTSNTNTGLDRDRNVDLHPYRKGMASDQISAANYGLEVIDPMPDVFLQGDPIVRYIPDKLRQHLIISTEGETPLQHLPLLLKYIWQSRRLPSRYRWSACHRIPVVVVHPAFPDNYRASFAKYDGKCLFFVEGCPTVRATWKRSKLQAAKGVVILADGALGKQATDASTIFLLMALDSFIKDSQNVFVAAELTEDQSLEYLREPHRPRRVGADHGDDDDDNKEEKYRKDAAVLKATSVDINRATDVSASVAGEKHEEDDKGSASRDRDAVFKTGSQLPSMTNRASSVENAAMAGGAVEAQVSSSRISLSNDGLGRAVARYAVPAPDPAENTSDSPPPEMLSRARRGSQFSRSRYASGDLLLHSPGLALLVREYVEPGFIKFYTEILGAGEKLGALKIRLVRIPASMFESASTQISSNGQLAVGYRVVFTRLMQLGATPLGLYRSGAAPVRLPTCRRARRGPEIEIEFLQYVRDNPAECSELGDDVEEKLTIKQRALKILRDVSDLAPQRYAERQAAKAWGLASHHEPDAANNGSEENDDASASNVHQSSSRLMRADRGNHESNTSSPTSQERRRARTIPSQFAEKMRLAPTRFRGRENSLDNEGEFEEQARPASNMLPYVFCFPEPYSLVSQRDGVYIMCDADFQLPRAWGEGYSQSAHQSLTMI
jgi:Ion channel/Calcium-activated BK potassium channel alpha subunit